MKASSEKPKKAEARHNNFLDGQPNEKPMVEAYQTSALRISNEKPTSMNNLSNVRPNTADDSNLMFQRGHRMFSKGIKMNSKAPKEKEEIRPEIGPQMKRAGTSNLLFRKTSRNGKKNTEMTQNKENGKVPHFNLFEKYQNFLV